MHRSPLLALLLLLAGLALLASTGVGDVESVATEERGAPVATAPDQLELSAAASQNEVEARELDADAALDDRRRLSTAEGHEAREEGAFPTGTIERVEGEWQRTVESGVAVLALAADRSGSGRMRVEVELEVRAGHFRCPLPAGRPELVWTVRLLEGRLVEIGVVGEHGSSVDAERAGANEVQVARRAVRALDLELHVLVAESGAHLPDVDVTVDRDRGTWSPEHVHPGWSLGCGDRLAASASSPWSGTARRSRPASSSARVSSSSGCRCGPLPAGGTRSRSSALPASPSTGSSRADASSS